MLEARRLKISACLVLCEVTVPGVVRLTEGDLQHYSIETIRLILRTREERVNRWERESWTYTD
jgi:hypothetical protein